MLRTEEGWISEYMKKDAYWRHDGNSHRPHALLTSGLHSDGFFNSRIVMADEVLRAEAAHDLIQKLCEERFGIGLVDRIVGPQTGATLLAEALAKEISSQRKRSCEWASPAKAGTGENRWMVFDDPERKVLPDERILLCEDVTTTGESVGRAASACDEAEGMLLRYVLILVNRSGLKEIDGRKPIALIDREMYNWKPDECPLCAQGSEAIRPRDPESNWARLIANY